MSEKRRLELKREAANLLRQLAQVLDNDLDRDYLDACADQIEASVDLPEKTVRVGRLPRQQRFN